MTAAVNPIDIGALTPALLLVAACATTPPITVRGELEWPDVHPRYRISECGTGTVYELGVMASNPYFRVGQMATELAANGPILAEIEGEPAMPTTSVAQDGADRVLNMPCFLSMKNGSCEAGQQ